MQGPKNMLRLDPEGWIATDRWWHAWNRHMFLFCFVQGKTQLGLSRMKLTPCCCSEDGITWEPCPEICKGSSVWLGNVTVMVWQWLIHSTKQMLAKKWVGTYGLTCDVGKEQLGDAQPVKILGQARFCALHSWAKASWTSINLSFLSASQISWCWSGKQCWWFFSYQTFSAASLIPNSEFILYASVQNLWAHVSFFCRYQSQLALKLKQVTTSLCCDVPRQSIRDNPRWGHWSQVISRVMMSLYRIQTHALKDNTWEDWHALSWNSSNQLHI